MKLTSALDTCIWWSSVCWHW